MALCNGLAFKLLKSVSLRSLGTQTAQAVKIQEEVLQTFRTNENNPAKHTKQHLGRYYTVPPSDIVPIIGDGEMPLTPIKKEIKTFMQWNILIRKPALEIISYLSQTDYSKPVNKYVLFGEDGTGKTLSLLHVIHYGYVTKKLIIYIPWLQEWYRFPRECANSETKEGLVDLPIDAAKLLLNFRNINALLLSKIDIKLSKDYVFGVDTFHKDAPITEMVDFGISRIKYACDVIDTLFNEIKLASIAGKCNTLVAVDGYNAIYSKTTFVKDDNKQKVPASRVSLTQSLLELTKSDWCNGQIVLTVDQKAVKDNRESHLPRYLLAKEGFNHLDPFLPVGVENYTQDEFDTVMEYYKNRKWIRNISEEGLKELRLVCGSNPYRLMDYCKDL
ncbi:28S ribosomal protein S29, mitochondrial [Copidosoma floridanum]|uniref:28S ribosomal protein S29, mitochondrial n=1 Tax=Copidosoma floridanum TaxID=29053 RepID=UPI0006C9B77F|nr:28S ribosomal protein S29, mitochondrial [Copidosoma floridanum]